MLVDHVVFVELTNQSLQNHVMGVLAFDKNLLIGRTKISFA